MNNFFKNIFYENLQNSMIKYKEDVDRYLYFYKLPFPCHLRFFKYQRKFIENWHILLIIIIISKFFINNYCYNYYFNLFLLFYFVLVILAVIDIEKVIMNYQNTLLLEKRQDLLNEAKIYLSIVDRIIQQSIQKAILFFTLISILK